MKSIIILLASFNLLMAGNGPVFQINQPKTNEIFEIIRDNINLFNQKSNNGEKEETFFREATKYYNVLSPYTDKTIGTLIIFDDNKGYITISNDHHVLDSNYNSGANIMGDPSTNNNLYYLAHNYSFDKQLLFESSYRGGIISEHFYWHANYSWATEKTRYLLTEYDSLYSTRVNTTYASIEGKTTWSTLQGSNNYCAAFAIANLLWTYKYNHVVDLTGGATTSYNLAWAIKEIVPAGANNFQISNINSSYYLSGTGYYIDYCDITDGISDTLETAPLIVLYNSGINDGHYALVTGKGESLFQTILWMHFYTSWDITNTWYDRYSYTDGYLNCKYWVDNQYASFGFVLRDNSGQAVAL